jgi:Uma2 family endonuclease
MLQSGLEVRPVEAFALPLRRWTRAEYGRMVETGIIQPDEHVELLDGEVVAMTPQKGPHAAVVDALREVLQDVFGAGWRIRVQLPLALGPRSEPEPDVAVVRGSRWDFVTDHPDRADLVVEVADSTLGKDRLRKAPLYAAAGIPEYWIIDLEGRAVEVYRTPTTQGDQARYSHVTRLVPGDTVRPLAKPEAAVAVDEFFPPV